MHCGPGFDSASNRNEYKEYFLGCKGGRCVGLTTLPPSCADCLKFGSLNFLEPSGPVQGLLYFYPLYVRTIFCFFSTIFIWLNWLAPVNSVTNFPFKLKVGISLAVQLSDFWQSIIYGPLETSTGVPRNFFLGGGGFNKFS
jgi:hypothetical protein